MATHIGKSAQTNDISRLNGAAAEITKDAAIRHATADIEAVPPSCGTSWPCVSIGGRRFHFCCRGFESASAARLALGVLLVHVVQNLLEAVAREGEAARHDAAPPAHVRRARVGERVLDEAKE